MIISYIHRSFCIKIPTGLTRWNFHSGLNLEIFFEKCRVTVSLEKKDKLVKISGNWTTESYQLGRSKKMRCFWKITMKKWPWFWIISHVDWPQEIFYLLFSWRREGDCSIHKNAGEYRNESIVKWLILFHTSLCL